MSHIAVATVLEAGHLRADRIVPARFLPDICGVHDGHQHLLPADGIDLLPDPDQLANCGGVGLLYPTISVCCSFSSKRTPTLYFKSSSLLINFFFVAKMINGEI